MNAAWSIGDQACFPSSKVAKITGQIAKPNERIVFMEEKILSPDAFMFPALTSCVLVDRLSVTHGSGTNFAFADGHTEYHQWQCQSTITWASGGASPAMDNCFQTKDGAWVQNAVWGD
jgi:prepilin-type processing-associated H-X9-DG protein